jgi:hypothetical protein
LLRKESGIRNQDWARREESEPEAAATDSLCLAQP